ncbi:uncharacterized [Tachysurus ichikawai]
MNPGFSASSLAVHFFKDLALSASQQLPVLVQRVHVEGDRAETNGAPLRLIINRGSRWPSLALGLRVGG